MCTRNTILYQLVDMLSKYIITMCVNIIIYIILNAFFSLEIFRGLSKQFLKNYHRPPHPLLWNGCKMQLFAKLKFSHILKNQSKIALAQYLQGFAGFLSTIRIKFLLCNMPNQLCFLHQ